MTEKDKLIEELRDIVEDTHLADPMNSCLVDNLVSYILDDRRRIVEPLVKSEYYHAGGSVLVDMTTVSDLLNIGCEVIRRAGVTL